MKQRHAPTSHRSSTSPYPNLRAISIPLADESPPPSQPGVATAVPSSGLHSVSRSSVAVPFVSPIGEDPSAWIANFVERCISARSATSGSTHTPSPVTNDTSLLVEYIAARRQQLSRQLVGATKAKIAALGGKRPKGVLRLDVNANRIVLCPSLAAALDALCMADGTLGASFPRGAVVAELMALSDIVRTIPKYNRYEGITVCKSVAALTSQAWLCASKLLRSSASKSILGFAGFEPALTMWIRATIPEVLKESPSAHSAHPNERREAGIRDSQVLSQLFEYGSMRNSSQTFKMMRSATSSRNSRGDGPSDGVAPLVTPLFYLQDLQHTVVAVREACSDASQRSPSTANDLIVIAAEIFCADFAEYQQQVVSLLRGSTVTVALSSRESKEAEGKRSSSGRHHNAESILDESHGCVCVPAEHDETDSHRPSPGFVEGALEYGAHEGNSEEDRNGNQMCATQDTERSGGGLNVLHDSEVVPLGRGTSLYARRESDSFDVSPKSSISPRPAHADNDQQHAINNDATDGHRKAEGGEATPSNQPPHKHQSSFGLFTPSPSGIPAPTSPVFTSPCARTLRPSDMLETLSAEDVSRNRFVFALKSPKADVGTPLQSPNRARAGGNIAESDVTPTQPNRVLSSLSSPPPGVRTPLRSVLRPRFQTRSVEWDNEPLPPAPRAAGDVLDSLDMYTRPIQLVEFISMCDSSAQEAYNSGRTRTHLLASAAQPVQDPSLFRRPVELEAASSALLQEEYYGVALGDAPMDSYVVEHMVREVKAFYESKVHKLSASIRERQNYNAALAEDIAKQRRHNAVYRRAIDFAVESMDGGRMLAVKGERASGGPTTLVDRMKESINRQEMRLAVGSKNLRTRPPRSASPPVSAGLGAILRSGSARTSPGAAAALDPSFLSEANLPHGLHRW